ncbi:MAG: HD domain-containing phosphohydrolase [Candidatus Coproplasma sp.]
MENVKLQAGCLFIIIYILVSCLREKAKGERRRSGIFFALIAAGIAEIVFDGVTAYTVNALGVVPDALNLILHLCFLLSLDLFIFIVFIYILSISEGLPSKKGYLALIITPFVINVAVVSAFIWQLEYRTGTTTNYSMGISVYACFVMAIVYIIMSVATLFRRWRYVEKHKKISILTSLCAMIAVTVFQMIFPELLITSLVPTVIILGAYLNQENPSLQRLGRFHTDMVTGFSTLIENRDDSTGTHVLRTTAYVKLIAGELQKRGYYKEQLTKDYISDLVMSAPMHDVGKIAIPDDILKKPARLTDEEFAIMKTHAERGGEIIKQTFGHTGRKEYCQMAYEVARYHHEKWNGRGYPEGLREEQIPLSARIMAVADVFDAVSAKRCYRDAMPLEECFKIIEEGSGRDFDPIIAKVFLDMRESVVEIFRQGQEHTPTLENTQSE